MVELPNFRALPGGRAAALQIYRSARLTRISRGQAEWLRDACKIRTYLDLRTQAEIVRDGEPIALLEAGVSWLRLGIESQGPHLRKPDMSQSSEVAAYYAQVLELLAEQWARAVAIIERRSAALVFGCSHGKDRTGILAALLLLREGASREQIVDDYEASREGLARAIDENGRPDTQLRARADTVSGATMELFLDRRELQSMVRTL